MLEEYRVLGVDPSLTRTGWALLDAWGEVLRKGSIVPAVPASAPYRERLNSIAYQLTNLLPDLAPTHVGQEEPALGGHDSTTLKLGKLNGAIGLGFAVQRPALRIVDLNIAEWRKIFGLVFPVIKGESRESRAERIKTTILAFAARRWPDVAFASVDEAEAALQGLRTLMHITGQAPIVVRPRKPKKKKKAAKSAAGV